MIAFIDDHRGAHGVEPICKVLPIAPSCQAVGPCQAGCCLEDRGPARIRRELLYGVRKVWLQLKGEGFDVGRCVVEIDAGHGFARGYPRHARQDHDQRQGCAMPATIELDDIESLSIPGQPDQVEQVCS